jgi:hypothetical protein
MFHGIEVNVVDMALQVGIVTNGVLAKTRGHGAQERTFAHPTSEIHRAPDDRRVSSCARSDGLRRCTRSLHSRQTRLMTPA